MPDFGPINGVFAHVWLGRGSALQNEHPLMNEFCKFFVELLPKRIILTHLEEFGRDASDFWDNEHVQKISSCISKLDPKISISSVSFDGRSKLNRFLGITF